MFWSQLKKRKKRKKDGMKLISSQDHFTEKKNTHKKKAVFLHASGRTYIDRVRLKNHLVKILQVIIPLILFTLFTYITHNNPD